MWISHVTYWQHHSCEPAYLILIHTLFFFLSMCIVQWISSLASSRDSWQLLPSTNHTIFDMTVHLLCVIHGACIESFQSCMTHDFSFASKTWLHAHQENPPTTAVYSDVLLAAETQWLSGNKNSKCFSSNCKNLTCTKRKYPNLLSMRRPRLASPKV